MSFVNLHAHSHYSLLDGFGSPKEIVLRAKELGYPAAALTDHGVTYGLLEFYQAAKAEGMGKKEQRYEREWAEKHKTEERKSQDRKKKATHADLDALRETVNEQQKNM